MKLNLKTIAALVLPEGKSEVIVFDEDLAGFGLRIRAGGPGFISSRSAIRIGASPSVAWQH